MENSAPSGFLNLSNQSLSSLESQSFQYTKAVTQFIDISRNKLQNASFLSGFSKLILINADYNFFNSLGSFPSLPTLDTLCLNSNQISDLQSAIDNISSKFPNIQHLSLIRNPCCPFLDERVTDQERINYRMTVIAQLPSLVSLDGSAVSNNEKEMATKWRRDHQFAPRPVVTPFRYESVPEPARDSPIKVSMKAPDKKKKATLSEGNRFITNKEL
ncbi:unnamed protein product [Blepharisma stoltei]|uniref:Uncharacterized protein n=1 Tax=Blepharisma stoltei TaxID=1481888 RepID=A0AAU9JF94_9CILI|nr:unnamed protein product [Blepharisma stoltei]